MKCKHNDILTENSIGGAGGVSCIFCASLLCLSDVDNTLPLVTDSCKDEALHECLGTHKAFR